MAGWVIVLGVLPVIAQETAERFLMQIDHALPSRIEGFYLVGSASLGAFQSARSDLDFVAVVNGDLDGSELHRLRRSHQRACVAAVLRSSTRVPPRWPLICNGVYVRWRDLSHSSLGVTPIASHVAERFSVGSGFDVNPVTWRTLGQRGISLRGPDPRQLGVYHDDSELRAWTLRNLDGYWRGWADAACGRGWTATLALLRRFAAWGVLGAPRLHFTVLTGEIATKEQAAQHSLEVFPRRWHPLIEEALAFWHGNAARGRYRDPVRRRRDAANFVTDVVDSATTRSRH